MTPFASAQTAKVTSALTSASITIPRGQSTMVVYNAAANPVHLGFLATAVVPGGAFAAEMMTVAGGSTQTFDISGQNETVVSYIAETAGGALYISLGQGI